MIVTLALIAVIAAVLIPLIQRDLTRATERRTVTVWITTDVSQYVAVLRNVARAAAELETAMRQVNRAAGGAGAGLKALRAHLEAEQAGREKPVF